MKLLKLKCCPSESPIWAKYLSRRHFSDSKINDLTQMFVQQWAKFGIAESSWDNPGQTWMIDPIDPFFMDVSNIVNLLRTIHFKHPTVVWSTPREFAEWAGKHPLFGKGLFLTNKFNFERIRDWQITNSTHWTLESTVFVPKPILDLVPQCVARTRLHRQGVTRQGDKYRGQYNSRTGQLHTTEFEAFMDFCVLRIETTYERLVSYQNQYQPPQQDLDTIVDGLLMYLQFVADDEEEGNLFKWNKYHRKLKVINDDRFLQQRAEILPRLISLKDNQSVCRFLERDFSKPVKAKPNYRTLQQQQNRQLKQTRDRAHNRIFKRLKAHPLCHKWAEEDLYQWVQLNVKIGHSNISMPQLDMGIPTTHENCYAIPNSWGDLTPIFIDDYRPGLTFDKTNMRFRVSAKEDGKRRSFMSEKEAYLFLIEDRMTWVTKQLPLTDWVYSRRARFLKQLREYYDHILAIPEPWAYIQDNRLKTE